MNEPDRRASPLVATVVGVVLAALLASCSLLEGSPVKLASSDAFEAYVTQDGQLVVLAGSMRSTTGPYASPPTLNEATVEYLHRDGRPVTAVVGPVRDEAERVVATSGDGHQAGTTPVEAFGWSWYWVELPGHVTIAQLDALNGNGEALDTSDRAPIPPPPDEL